MNTLSQEYYNPKSARLELFVIRFYNVSNPIIISSPTDNEIGGYRGTYLMIWFVGK